MRSRQRRVGGGAGDGVTELTAYGIGGPFRQQAIGHQLAAGNGNKAVQTVALGVVEQNDAAADAALDLGLRDAHQLAWKLAASSRLAQADPAPPVVATPPAAVDGQKQAKTEAEAEPEEEAKPEFAEPVVRQSRTTDPLAADLDSAQLDGLRSEREEAYDEVIAILRSPAWAQVRADLESSLDAIAQARPARDWGPYQLALTGVTCEDEPVCALAVACYQDEPWRAADIDLRQP